LSMEEPSPGHLVVTGTIAAGSKPTLAVIEVSNPAAFARTAFIEALQRAGVTVTAAPTGPNPATLLPAKDSYQPADKVAEHVSATLAQFINLIMKVSYNRGADLLLPGRHPNALCADAVRFAPSPRQERDHGERLAELARGRTCPGQDR